MTPVWTHTSTVREGREEEFVAGWRRMAEGSMSELDVPEAPTLLRVHDRPNVFISFGPWPDDAAVERFRSSAAFTEGVAAIQPLLEQFEPTTLDQVWRG
jgi:quinol monooxygenase YgiN